MAQTDIERIESALKLMEQRQSDTLQRMEERQTDTHGRLEQLAAYRIVDSNTLQEIRVQQQTMCVSGCAVGKQNAEKIAEMKKEIDDAPAKLAAIASVIGMAAGGLIWFVKSVIGTVNKGGG